MRAKLGAVCEVRSGVTLREGFTASIGGVPAIQPSDISPDGQVDLERVLRIDRERIAARHLMLSGDVLFRSRGVQATAYTIGEQLIEPTVAAMPLFIIRALPDVLDPRYLAWYLNQPAAQRHFAQGADGTSVRMIKKPVLENVELEIPPLAVQQTIGAVVELAAKEHDLAIRLAHRHQTLTDLSLAETAAAAAVATANNHRQDLK